MPRKLRQYSFLKGSLEENINSLDLKEEKETFNRRGERTKERVEKENYMTCAKVEPNGVKRGDKNSSFFACLVTKKKKKKE